MFVWFRRWVRTRTQPRGTRTRFDPRIPLDGCLRRRVPMCYWKQWRRPSSKVQNVVALAVSLEQETNLALSRKKYWRMSRTPALHYPLPNELLEQQGFLSLKHLGYQRASRRGTAKCGPTCKVVWGPPSAMMVATRFRCSFHVLFCGRAPPRSQYLHDRCFYSTIRHLEHLNRHGVFTVV